MWKRQFHKSGKCTKHENDLPLRMRYPDFGLKTGSRGTPWNRKSAQPGGSENAKCQKPPFIWHFDHFGVFHFFHFSLLHFCVFLFFHFSGFCILSLFLFFWFSGFWWFSCFYWFWWKHDFSLFYRVFQFLKGYGKDKALFWPLFGPSVHSHGKHLEGVNSLCEI